MSADSAERSDTLIRGNCEMAGKTFIALFDTGASHSFIAFKKASDLGLKIVMLAYDLEVHTATSEAIITAVYIGRFRTTGGGTGHYLNSVVVNYSGSECQGFMLLTASVLGDEQSLNPILVVNEFPKVFPKDIPEFPPSQEIEFVIELVLGVGPISIVPYRTSPLELAELQA
ncbi:uncharacterized protein LOC130980776 [Arachis stenosperma]|uniref:uncharacterized protein LOC130980776 n=1 Tax=Arachis stenosperma TaxID=217475 RepID=UPI0025ACCEBB|nr:uncharacterized protein LOC130980776 [Arachis stenosperma]